MRRLTVERRTAQVNQVRGLLLEYGIEIPQGRAALMRRLPELLEDAENGLSERFRAELNRLLEELRHLDERVKHYDAQLQAIAQSDATAQRLMTIPGLGAQGATALLAAVGETLAKTWLNSYRVAIKALSDERQEIYRLIKGMSAEPVDIDLAKPTSWMEATVILQPDGSKVPLPTYEHHLLCDEQGTFPAELNAWEVDVLKSEMARPGFQAWYRNPSRASQDALGISYTDNGQFKIVRPDFIFFAQQADGSIVADIVDPHGTQFSDALPKLQGLAHYAETHPTAYRRIEVVAKVGNRLRVLDLTDATVRKAVGDAPDAKSLYDGVFANDY